MQFFDILLNVVTHDAVLSICVCLPVLTFLKLLCGQLTFAMDVSNMIRVIHQWMSLHVRLCVTLSCLAGYQPLLNWQTLYTGTACPKALQALLSHNTVIWTL